MQLLGRHYLGHGEEAESVCGEGVSSSETDTLLCGEEELEALCEIVEDGGRMPPWMRAAAEAVRENRRHFLTAASVLVIGFAVYLNWSMAERTASNALLKDNPGTDGGSVSVGEVLENENDSTEKDEYFAVSQINRQRARDEAIAVLQEVVEGAANLTDVQSEAFAQISRIAADIEHEAAIESLIKGKGFADCVAVISGDLASIIVKTSALLPNEVAQIQEIVYETAGILPVNVKIIEK
ncbi:MAG: SpoIIIAH-like family protein [Clostridia bacterium]|nr:SpoIIIAH-like family protein [Clostridia bacterium]